MADAPSALLTRAADGDREAAAMLTPLVYDQLRALAGQFLSEMGNGRILLQRTALVHEAYLKIIGHGGDLRTQTHFCAVAATAMRQALLDHLREQKRDKRGGGWQPMSLSGLLHPEDGDDQLDLEALDAALHDLSNLDDRAAQIIQLRFFGGLTEPEVADVLGVSERTIRTDWAMARAWLRTHLNGQERRI